MAKKYTPVDNPINVTSANTAENPAKGTKDNDIFQVSSGIDAYISAGNQATDTLVFKDITVDGISASHIKDTKDLAIKYYYNSKWNTITIKDYFTSAKATATKSALKILKYNDGSAHEFAIASDIAIANTATIKNNKITGTNFGDDINVSSESTGYTINSGNGNDTIVGSKVDDTINGGNGDDTIWGNFGDDILTGGKGKNTYTYNASAESGDDTIKLTNGEKVSISSIGGDVLKAAYTLDGKGNATVTFDKTDVSKGSVTLNGFAKKDITSEAKYMTTNLKTAVWDIAATGDYKGSWLDENIDAKDADEKLKKGKHVDISLNGGNGNDTIESSMYADKVTGGAGTNTYLYTSAEQLEGDKIYLTKGENARINVSGLGNCTPIYTLNGKNLDITVGDATFTIVNFGTKDVTNTSTQKNPADTSSVLLTYQDGGSTVTKILRTEDLATGILVNSDKGTYHNDYIDKSDYYNKKGKGLTINGGAGKDTIIGTDYADTIKAGTGFTESITGGEGNDKLYGSTTENSTTTFIFKKGDGVDTIYNASKNDKIQITDVAKDNLKYVQNGNDLEIFYSDDYDTNDMIVIKNHFKLEELKRINTLIDKDGSTVNISAQYIVPSGSGKIDASSNNEVLVGSAKADTIKAGEYTGVVIAGEGGSDKLYASTSTSGVTTFKFNAGNGKDTVYSGNGSNDILDFGDISLSSIDFSQGSGKSKNDLIIKYSKKDSVTIKDYYADTNSVKRIKTKEGTFSISNVIIGSGTINGTDNNDTIIGSAKADVIDAKAGKDLIFAKGGDDTIYTGTGDDIVNAGAGNNTIIFGDEGSKTIQNGGGTDTLDLTAFVTSDKIGSMRGEVSGNDAIIHKPQSLEKITLQDFLSADTSVKYIKNGDNTYGFVFSNKDEINGSNENDLIYVASSDDTEQTVNAGAGNDVIHITDDADVSVYVGTGDDTVRLKDNGNTAPKVDIYFEKEDGDNTLTGLSNYLGDDAEIVLKSDDLIKSVDMGENIGQYSYISGTRTDNGTGDDLILDLPDNKTFTIKNYYSTSVSDDTRNKIKVGDSDTTLSSLLVENRYIHEITGSSWLEDTENEYLGIAPDNKSSELTLDLYKDIALVKGSGYQTVKFDAMDSTLYLYNTGGKVEGNVNRVYVDDDNNTVHLSGAYANIVVVKQGLDASSNIYIYDGDHCTVTTDINNSIVDVNCDTASSESMRNNINSHGIDNITLRSGRNTIDLIDNDPTDEYQYDKIITMSKDVKNTQIGSVNPDSGKYEHTVLDAKNTDITQLVTDDTEASEIVFEHYGKENGVDIRYVDEYMQVLNYNNNGLRVNGTLSDLDTAAGVAKFTVSLQKESDNEAYVTRQLNQMTQFVDMDHFESDDDNFEHKYVFNTKSKSGLLDSRKDAYIKGSEREENDLYSGYTFANKGVTIADYAQDDSDQLVLGMGRSDYKFFIDFDNTGRIADGDLIIYKYDATEGHENDGLYKHLSGEAASDYLEIKDELYVGNQFDFGYGYGQIEKITDDDSDNFDIKAYYDNIKQDVVSWFETYASDYTTVSNAIQGEGGLSDEALNALYTIYCDNMNWVNY